MAPRMFVSRGSGIETCLDQHENKLGVILRITKKGAEPPLPISCLMVRSGELQNHHRLACALRSSPAPAPAWHHRVLFKCSCLSRAAAKA
eukprot:1143504-Pelagomonas_calceolata.AAC.1